MSFYDDYGFDSGPLEVGEDLSGGWDTGGWFDDTFNNLDFGSGDMSWLDDFDFGGGDMSWLDDLARPDPLLMQDRVDAELDPMLVGDGAEEILNAFGGNGVYIDPNTGEAKFGGGWTPEEITTTFGDGVTSPGGLNSLFNGGTGGAGGGGGSGGGREPDSGGGFNLSGTLKDAFNSPLLAGLVGAGAHYFANEAVKDNGAARVAQHEKDLQAYLDALAKVKPSESHSSMTQSSTSHTQSGPTPDARFTGPLGGAGAPQWSPAGQGRENVVGANPVRKASGGRISPLMVQKFKAMGVLPEGVLPKGYVRGGTSGQADAIPAKLSDGEYVMDADTVAALGDGNNEAGAKKLDQMRQNLRRHKRSAPANKIPPKAKRPEQYLKRGK